MKKLIVAAIAMFSMVGHAELTQNCKNDMMDAAKHRQMVVKGIEEGQITSETADYLMKGADDLAEIVALTCAGLKKIELQSSMANRLGLISVERGNRIAEETKIEALEFYKSLNN